MAVELFHDGTSFRLGLAARDTLVCDQKSSLSLRPAADELDTGASQKASNGFAVCASRKLEHCLQAHYRTEWHDRHNLPPTREESVNPLFRVRPRCC